MVLAGADRLSANEGRINALNVFPVPDGDTGTNMNLTMTAGTAALTRKPTPHIGQAAETLSKGLLMGARGNSGVILSQLFRGFSRAVAGEQELTVSAFAHAMQQGVDTAYKAVVKPVEGTILTVAREAARHAVLTARRTSDYVAFMEEVLAKATDTLARTPDMLPVLKQVGVVDSGGQGLVYLFEGSLAWLRGEASSLEAAPVAPRAAVAIQVDAPAQVKLETDSIEYPYDMEFFIHRPARAGVFDEHAFRKQLETDGDSIILIEDENIVKVHVHSRRPGDVLNAALALGELTHLHIVNMREQHKELLQGAAALTADVLTAPDDPEAMGFEAASGIPIAEYEFPEMKASPESIPNPDAYELAPYGIVAVSTGDGNAELFRSLGVDVVLAGGQSMNPSTEELLEAMNALSAQSLIVLPNNPNIHLAAQQAAELSERSVNVLPTRSIPDGMAAMLAFQEDLDEATNAERMTEAFEKILTGSITQAVRDSQMDGIPIQAGEYIGILDKTIVVSAATAEEACRRLLERMLGEGDEIVTILTGEEADAAQTDRLETWLVKQYPDVEVEVHEGGQHLYPYLIAVDP